MKKQKTVEEHYEPVPDNLTELLLNISKLSENVIGSLSDIIDHVKEHGEHDVEVDRVQGGKYYFLKTDLSDGRYLEVTYEKHDGVVKYVEEEIECSSRLRLRIEPRSVDQIGFDTEDFGSTGKWDKITVLYLDGLNMSSPFVTIKRKSTTSELRVNAYQSNYESIVGFVHKELCGDRGQRK